MEEEKLSFEEAFRQLEETVRALEGGDLALAEMVALYERGVRLADSCSRLLDEAEMRVTQLTPPSGWPTPLPELGAEEGEGS